MMWNVIVNLIKEQGWGSKLGRTYRTTTSSSTICRTHRRFPVLITNCGNRQRRIPLSNREYLSHLGWSKADSIMVSTEELSDTHLNVKVAMEPWNMPIYLSFVQKLSSSINGMQKELMQAEQHIANESPESADKIVKTLKRHSRTFRKKAKKVKQAYIIKE